MKLTELISLEERKNLLEQTVKPFKERASKHDKEASFPFENIENLKEIAYHTLTIPKEYGGPGITLTEMLKYQETIAKADGSTALAIGWHMGLTKHNGENNSWENEKYTAFAKDVMKNGALINHAITEPATGSPQRGGKPETFAVKNASGWKINGKKTFTTLAPALHFFVVASSIEGSDKIGHFLVKSDLAGVSIDETWDSIAMRGTGSHDLILKNVQVNEDDLVEYREDSNNQPASWILHIPACYLGVAKAAQEEAVKFTTTYSPNSIKGTISELPNVKQKLGEIELYLLEAENFLYSISRRWDESDKAGRQKMAIDINAAKVSVVDKAIKIVDLAMRVVGARSLSEKSPLQRYYRDVRAGLHNPPMDDMIIMQLAKKSITDYQLVQNKAITYV